MKMGNPDTSGDAVKPIRRVILLDDHPIQLHGLEVVLNRHPGLQVVGCHSNAGKFLAALERDPNGVDVAIIDFVLSPEDMDCRSLLLALRRRFPRLPVLVLSAHYTPVTVAAAMKAGARGYLPKVATPEQIVSALENVGKEGRPGSDIRLAQNDGTTGQASAKPPGLKELTPREREVLKAVLKGLSTNQIAERFGRAASTVSSQKFSGFRKLGIGSDGELFNNRHLLSGNGLS
jgi:DNA-binding NarL/FixJ family response regulator